MKKESRETFHRLTKGSKFKTDLYVEVFEGKKIHEDDWDFVLDELKKIAGINK